MKDLEIQKQFIELRSKGFSFDSISKTINVSKPVLINWAKMFETEISDLQKLELDDMKDTLLIAKKHRLELLSGMLDEIKSQMKEQPLLLSYAGLVKLSLKIIQQLDRAEYYDFKKNMIVNRKIQNNQTDEIQV
jgi:hypothetical protein